MSSMGQRAFGIVITSVALTMITACGDGARFECETTSTCACTPDGLGRAKGGCSNVAVNECSFATCTAGQSDFKCGLGFHNAGTVCSSGSCDGDGNCVPGGGASGGVGGAGATGGGGSGGIESSGSGGGGTGGQGGEPFAPTLQAGRIGAQSFTTCFVTSVGRVACWGNNAQGTLGLSDLLPAYSVEPITVPNLVNMVSISAVEHACAVNVSGSIYCWGRNAEGQLGHGSATPAIDSTPRQVGGIIGVQQVSVGTLHTCAVTMNGQTHCWGANASGQTGFSATTQFQLTPSPNTAPAATLISSGDAHSCIRVSAAPHPVWCWGNNMSKQVNSSAQASVFGPVLAAVTESSDVAAGNHHTCALRPTGSIKCWGLNDFGQLGSVVNGDVSSVSSAIAVEAGNRHTCAIMSDFTMMCWGLNNFGQLGNVAAGTESTTPVQVPGLTNVVDIDLGSHHTCALTDDFSGETLHCWGRNNFGQVGDGTEDHRDTPVPIPVP